MLPGPLKTRAASELRDLDPLNNEAVWMAPVGILGDIMDVGFTCAYLAGDNARRVPCNESRGDARMSCDEEEPHMVPARTQGQSIQPARWQTDRRACVIRVLTGGGGTMHDQSNQPRQPGQNGKQIQQIQSREVRCTS